MTSVHPLILSLSKDCFSFGAMLTGKNEGQGFDKLSLDGFGFAGNVPSKGGAE